MTPNKGKDTALTTGTSDSGRHATHSLNLVSVDAGKGDIGGRGGWDALLIPRFSAQAWRYKFYSSSLNLPLLPQSFQHHVLRPTQTSFSS